MKHGHKEGGGASDRTALIDVAAIKPRRPSVAIEAVQPPTFESPQITEPKFSVPTPLPAVVKREWRPFRFKNLAKVSKAQAKLLRGLEWLLPNVRSTGEVSESVRLRLQELIDPHVSLATQTMSVVGPHKARQYLADPAFLAVLSPLPNKSRGLLEVELSLAHMVIDMLLGGAGESVALRPLTDIEEGVLTYVLIETLRTLAPSLDPALPRLRIDTVCRGYDEAAAIFSDDEQMALVQFKAVFGEHSGYIRLFIPESILNMSHPPVDSDVRRARRSYDASQNASRLSHVKVLLRAEIGQVEVSADDLGHIREGDVILLEALKTRPDLGESGTATLKLGLGRTGEIEADVVNEGGRYLATVTQIRVGEPRNGAAPGEDANEPLQPKQLRSADLENPEGSDLLNDIPLQIVVELGRVPMTAEDVLALKVGHVIDLNRSAGEPLDLSVQGKVVARGELVEVDGNLGVRILSLAG